MKVAALREARQWLTELRRWGQILAPAAKRTVARGRAEAKPKALEPDVKARVIDALHGMGYKKRVAELAVSAALAENATEDSDQLLRAALRKL